MGQLGMSEKPAGGMPAVAGACLALFWSGSLAFALPGVMGPYWQQAFQVGRGAVGGTLFMMLAGVGCFMYLAGRWQLALGIPQAITLGSILCALAMFLSAFAQGLGYIYAWAFLVGISQSFVYVPALTTAQLWYPQRRGLVSGLVSLVFAGSAAVMSPVFAWFLEHAGYLATNLAIAGATLVCGVVGARFTAPPAGSALDRGAPAAEDDTASVGRTLRSSSFWMLWGTVALMGAGGIAMVTLGTSYGLSLGLDLGRAVVILTVFNLGSGLSRLIMGYASDHLPRARVMSLAFFSAGVAYLLLPWAGEGWGLGPVVLLAGVIGYAFGTMWAVAAPLVTDCFGPRHFGEVFGLLFTAYGFISGALGPSLGGFLADWLGSFFWVFFYLVGLCLVAGLLITRVRPLADRGA